MTMMNRRSSETMPASSDRSVSSSYPKGRRVGCEAHVPSSVSRSSTAGAQGATGDAHATYAVRLQLKPHAEWSAWPRRGQLPALEVSAPQPQASQGGLHWLSDG
jgi:hypothetical protein